MQPADKYATERQSKAADKSALRDAATVIMLRDQKTRPRILMGKRGSSAAFMPNKFVFPGGAVDAQDSAIALDPAMSAIGRRLLGVQADPASVVALQAAAIREVWEETGLVLGRTGGWKTAPPPNWDSFAATGHRPSADGFHFIFRAITPPGRPRRFDARFFLVDAGKVQGDPDDFSHASDELSDLQWVAIDQARDFNLPFITEVVLAEVANFAKCGTLPDTVPFFRNDDEESQFLRLDGASPLTRNVVFKSPISGSESKN
ncbi:MAG: NUDIX domain-containing protein [Halocynthiibacter sp.]